MIQSESAFYRWHKQFGDTTAAEAQLLKNLEKERIRLKRLERHVRDLGVNALKDCSLKKPDGYRASWPVSITV